MKKSKKNSLVWYIVAGVFAVSGLYALASGTSGGLATLAVAAVLAFVGYKKSSGVKKSKKAASDRAAVNTVHVQGKPVADPERAEREARRAAYLDRQREEFSNALAAIPRVDISVSEDKVTRQAPSDMPEFHFTNITKRTHIDKIFPLVVIDTETTGLTPRGNDIIEVSAIRYESGFVPVSCFTSLLKARKPIPPEASATNNITDDMIKDKPYFSEIAASFSDYISDCNIVGHNLPFDLKFLYVCGASLPETAKYYDTYDLVKRTLVSSKSKKWNNEIGASVPVENYDVEDYKLETLCDYYGIYRADAHRSLSDCFATAKIFEHLIDDKMNKE